MAQNEQTAQTESPKISNRPQGTLTEKAPINTHFTLAIVAVCFSCLSGFVTIALGLAALIFSLRAQDQLSKKQTQEAADTAWWAGLFGWLTVIISLFPILVFIFFGGAILAALGALLSL